MKRYIEIVYDNSGSMKNRISNSTKSQIAVGLFEKEILPTIGLKDDKVVLRVLGNRCYKGNSYAEFLDNDRNSMLQRIRSITYDNSTPLYYTVFDAIEACKRVVADECLIFVLTDGDDTCGRDFKDVIDTDILNRFVSSFKMLLVQFAVDSQISRNNLTAFANSLKGQVISLNGTDPIPVMRRKLNNALRVSGFSDSLPLEPCFKDLTGKEMDWEELGKMGISLHQAKLLYFKEMLSWDPEQNQSISALKQAELRFLHALLFKSGVSEDLTKAMLSQLKKPYYYSFDCIYWDFAAARWKYFPKQNEIDLLPNPEAQFQDEQKNLFTNNIFVEKPIFESRMNELYSMNKVYTIKEVLAELPGFKLIEEVNMPSVKTRLKNLKKGDRVIFKK